MPILIKKQTIAFTDSEKRHKFKVSYWIAIKHMLAK